MPIISSLVLTNKNPVITYTASVVTSGSVIADGLGNQITYLYVTCSYADTASIQTSWEQSSSFASQSMWSISSSFASKSLSSSCFFPSKGTVTNAGPITGSASASGYGFTTATEFNNFVTSTSSSLQQLNTLLSYLRSSGIIS